MLEALVRNETLSGEEKRAEVRESVQAPLLALWKKYKYAQALLVRILLALLRLEYVAPELTGRVARGLLAHCPPADRERLLPLYDAMAGLHGELSRARGAE